MLTVAREMWRQGVRDAIGLGTVAPWKARAYAKQAKTFNDVCCRAYWLAYARTIRSQEPTT